MLAHLVHRFYWTGMSDDVKEWLGQCVRPLRQEEIPGGPPSPIRKHSNRSPLGSYRDGYLGRL